METNGDKLEREGTWGLGGEGLAEYGETVAMYNQFFFMKIGLLLVPIPKIIQTKASNQMKMICLYHSGTGKPPSYTSYFGKLATSQKRWPYVNHENQNLFGMTDRETGMGGGGC